MAVEFTNSSSKNELSNSFPSGIFCSRINPALPDRVYFLNKDSIGRKENEIERRKKGLAHSSPHPCSPLQEGFIDDLGQFIEIEGFVQAGDNERVGKEIILFVLKGES
jgi:hypothetical protein